MAQNPEIQKELVKGIKNHPFEYGFATALQQPNSRISKQGGEYTLFFTPSGVNDRVWFGDCATDALLTVKALHGFQLDENTRVEDYKFGFHGAGFTATHYRAYYGGERLPMDHSKFYARLNMEYAEGDETQVDPNLELIGDIGVEDGSRNYGEFEDGDNLYLTTFSVMDVEGHPNHVLVQACVYEQDIEGVVGRRLESSHFLPKNLADEIDQNEIRAMFGLNRVYTTRHGQGGWESFPDGLVKDKTVECLKSVVNAIVRGNKQG